MKVSVIVGTRPEAIKMAPLILALQEDTAFACHVCSTGQHRAMLDQVFEAFDIEPDVDLGLMQTNQSLAVLTSRAVEALHQYMAKERPDLVLVQGDTTTVFCAALAAFYQKVPVGHVEAGLRTSNLQSPWPEEANRVLTTRLASLHFAPTQKNRHNLLNEGVSDDRIYVTGNTVIDALFLAREKTSQNPPHISGLPEILQPASFLSSTLHPRLVLITGHRRENFGRGLENICRAIGELSRRFPDVHFVYPVHLNPNVQEPVKRLLSQTARRHSGATGPDNVHLISPVEYLGFVALMGNAILILTDSGGIQEEAPSLGKPVLVMRDTTERAEAVRAGGVKLVGTSVKAIVDEAASVLRTDPAGQKPNCMQNPYGDGQATHRILAACKSRMIGTACTLPA